MQLLKKNGIKTIKLKWYLNIDRETNFEKVSELKVCLVFYEKQFSFFPIWLYSAYTYSLAFFLLPQYIKGKKNVKKIKVLQFWPTCEFCSHLVRLMDNGERKSESSTKPRSVWNFSKLLLKVLAAILGAGCQRVEVMPLGWTWNNWNPHETWRTPRWAPCHFSLAIPVSPVLFLWPHTSDFQHFFFFFLNLTCHWGDALQYLSPTSI